MEEMSSHPDLERMRALIADVHAPASLRERIAEDARRTAPRRMVQRRLRLTGALAGVAAAAGATLAIVLPAGAPTVLQAAELATRAPVAAAPPADAAHPASLRRSVGGVSFPTWSGRYPWRASGQRSDTLGGRHTVTVFYDGPGGARLAYTIVNGKALSWPSGSRRIVRNGVEVHVLRHDGRILATWRERGHQCVISAPASVSPARMIELAASDATPEAAADPSAYA